MATQQPVQPPAGERPLATADAAEAGASRRPVKTPRSRAGAAWVGICIAALLLAALIVFLLQNTRPVLVTFLSMQGTVPLAIALLIAGIGVGVVALVIGSGPHRSAPATPVTRATELRVRSLCGGRRPKPGTVQFPSRQLWRCVHLAQLLQ